LHSLTDPQMQHELLKWYDVITRQNYLTSNQDIVIQQDGLTMGVPSSGIIATIFLQHTEHAPLTNLTHKHSNINYFQYVDKIPLIFETTLTYRRSKRILMPYTRNYSLQQKQKETTL